MRLHSIRQHRFISCVLVLISLLFSTPQASAQAVSFIGARQFDVGFYPHSIAAGDFNGDGLPDLVVVDFSSIHLLLGNGDGTFQPARRIFIANSEVGAVAAADFNGDGFLDIAVTVGNCSRSCSPGSVLVFLGNGDGSFRTPVSYGLGIQPIFIAVGDFNGDTKPDLAIVNKNCAPDCGAGIVNILLGNGDGTFQEPTWTAVGTKPIALTLGDFDNDGKLDMAVVDVNSLAIFLGDGNGTFQASRRYSITGDPVSIASGDFNADGKLDLAFTSRSCDSLSCALSLQTARGNGDGSFQSFQNVAPVAGVVSVGDLNGDGKPDLAVSNGEFLSVLLGQDDGTFQQPRNFLDGGSRESMVLVDLNLDGKLDVVLPQAGSRGRVTVLLGYGDGNLVAASSILTVLNRPFTAVGDFNGDGKLDMAVTSSECTATCRKQLLILLGNGDGTFQPPLVSYPVAGIILVADFNGDGKLDLAVLDDNNMAILIGNGDGTFQSPVNYTAGLQPGSAAVGDFNGDGILDLIVPNRVCPTTGCKTGATGGLWVLLGNGDGTFRPGTFFEGGNGPLLAVAGDFNEDGKLDVLVSEYAGASMFFGNGDGTFQAPHPVGVPGPSQIVAADFNGDGLLDLAVASYNACASTCDDGAVVILLGNGDGTFRSAGSYDAGWIPSSIALGDFNGDGKLDLAVTSWSASVSILISNGDGTFQSKQDFVPGSGPSLSAGDFNGDGKLDLAFAGYLGNNKVSILLNNTPSPSALP